MNTKLGGGGELGRQNRFKTFTDEGKETVASILYTSGSVSGRSFYFDSSVVEHFSTSPVLKQINLVKKKYPTRFFHNSASPFKIFSERIFSECIFQNVSLRQIVVSILSNLEHNQPAILPFISLFISQQKEIANKKPGQWKKLFKNYEIVLIYDLKNVVSGVKIKNGETRFDISYKLLFYQLNIH